LGTGQRKQEKRFEFVDAGFNSREKLNHIERSIFTDKEIERLKAYRCIANCRISTNEGRIVEISFYFPSGNPDICIKKLAGYARLIKREITFELHFAKEIEQHGFYSQSFLAFRSVN
jgi:hypothetical protein